MSFSHFLFISESKISFEDTENHKFQSRTNGRENNINNN
jgi:hypothetical protein